MAKASDAASVPAWEPKEMPTTTINHGDAAIRSYFAHDVCGATWSLDGDVAEAVCPNCDVLVIRRPRRMPPAAREPVSEREALRLAHDALEQCAGRDANHDGFAEPEPVDEKDCRLCQALTAAREALGYV